MTIPWVWVDVCPIPLSNLQSEELPAMPCLLWEARSRAEPPYLYRVLWPCCNSWGQPRSPNSTECTPDYDKSEWLKEKETLGLDFPNLVYFIDGPVKLTQSNAILRYIARKHNLCGGSEEEMSRVDLLVEQAMDVRLELGSVVYNPNLKTLKGQFLEKLPGKLRLFSRFLGERTWFAGEQITFVDFLMYDILDQHRVLEPKCLESFCNLNTFMQDFEALEKINAFMKTSCFKEASSNAMARLWNAV